MDLTVFGVLSEGGWRVAGYLSTPPTPRASINSRLKMRIGRARAAQPRPAPPRGGLLALLCMDMRAGPGWAGLGLLTPSRGQV